MNVFDLSATLTLDSSQYENGLARAEGKARSAGGSGGGFSVLKGAMANLVSGGINMVAGALTNNLGSAFARVDTMNNYGTVMKNLGNDSKQAEAEIKRLGDGIDGLPTALDQITSMQQQFASLGGSLSDATDLTLALNNATLAGGRGQVVASSAMQQWYQIIAKGKPDAQSMYIINDAMPAQMKAISEKVLGAGKTFQDLNTEWQKNPEITEKVKDAIIDLNKNGFGEMGSFEQQAKDATKGIQTGLQNLQTAITKGMANFMMDSGLDAVIGARLEDVKNIINDLFGQATEFAKNTAKEYSEGGFEGVAVYWYEALIGQIESLKDMASDAIWNGYVALMSVDWDTVFSKALSGLSTIFADALELALDYNTLQTQLTLRLQTVVENMITGFIDAVANDGDKLIESGLDAVVSFVQGIYDNATKVVEGATELVDNLANYICEHPDEIIAGAGRMVKALATGLVKGIPKILASVGKLALAIVRGIIKIIPSLLKAGASLIRALASGIIKNASKAVSAVRSLGSKIVRGLKKAVDNVGEIGSNIVKGIWSGISNGYKWITGRLKSWIGNVTKFIKKVFKIGSPSKLMADEVGQWIPKGIAKGIEDNSDSVDDALEDVLDVPEFADFGTSDGMFTNGMKMVQFAPNITVDGAENPESYAQRLMEEMKREVRAS